MQEEKTEIIFQRHGLRWGCSLLLLLAAFAFNSVTEKYIRNDMVFYISTALFMCAALFLYYRLTDRMDFFFRKGYFCLEEGKLILYTNRRHELTDVKEMILDDYQAFGAHSSMMQLKRSHGKILLFSQPDSFGDNVRNSVYWPLAQAVLAANPGLEAKALFGEPADGWWVKNP